METVAVKIDAGVLRDLIDTVAGRLIAHADELTALDQAIGDGDHGLNMKRGFEAVLAERDAGEAAAGCAEGDRHDAGHEGRRRLRAALRNAFHGARQGPAGRPDARRFPARRRCGDRCGKGARQIGLSARRRCSTS